MDDSAVPLIGGLLFGIISPLLIFGFVIGIMVLLPLVMKKRIDGWTEGKANPQIWEALEQGATRGWFQVRPASYLYESELATPLPPGQALHKIHAFFSSGWGRKVLSTDNQSVVFSLRFFPFLAADLGWIGAAWAYQGPQGTAVRFRFRSTYMLPVITFFLSFRLRLYVLNRVLA